MDYKQCRSQIILQNNVLAKLMLFLTYQRLSLLNSNGRFTDMLEHTGMLGVVLQSEWADSIAHTCFNLFPCMQHENHLHIGHTARKGPVVV